MVVLSPYRNAFFLGGLGVYAVLRSQYRCLGAAFGQNDIAVGGVNKFCTKYRGQISLCCPVMFSAVLFFWMLATLMPKERRFLDSTWDWITGRSVLVNGLWGRAKNTGVTISFRMGLTAYQARYRSQPRFLFRFRVCLLGYPVL